MTLLHLCGFSGDHMDRMYRLARLMDMKVVEEG